MLNKVGKQQKTLEEFLKGKVNKSKKNIGRCRVACFRECMHASMMLFMNSYDDFPCLQSQRNVKEAINLII